MKVLLEGDKSKAVCERCAAVVQTTLVLRDAPFSDGSGIVKNSLVGVIDAVAEHYGSPQLRGS